MAGGVICSKSDGGKRRRRAAEADAVCRVGEGDWADGELQFAAQRSEDCNASRILSLVISLKRCFCLIFTDVFTIHVKVYRKLKGVFDRERKLWVLPLSAYQVSVS